MAVIIVVPYYWGRSETISGAWKQVKKESHSTMRELKSGPHKIYFTFDTEEVKTYVNEYGALCYPSGQPPVCIEDKTEKK